MFIIHVTPLTKTTLHRLSYFSATQIPVGTLIHVPLRNKEIPALVIEQEDARAIKAALRTNLYETKKIRDQEATNIFTPQFIRAAHESAQHFATATGSIIQAFTPKAVLSTLTSDTLPKPTTEPEKKEGYEHLVLQLPFKERVEKYKSFIRGTFAKEKSVFLVVPTVQDAEMLTRECSRGIEQYTFTLHSSLTKKKQLDIWAQALSEAHPVLIIATPVFASIPRADIGVYILEHELSSAYKQHTRPRADARVLFQRLARASESTFVSAGTMVSLHTQRKLREETAQTLEEHTRTLRSASSVEIIDLKEVRESSKKKKEEFPVLSPESIARIRACHEGGEKTFIFAARRGIATQTVCNDCQHVVSCHTCSGSLTLHERGTTRELLCHRCGHSRSANETCGSCGSWNLLPLGIGIERIDNFLRLQCRDIPLFVLSSDTAKTPKEARAIVDAFQSETGGVLVGTEMALPYVPEADCSIMSSIDSLLSIPDFRIEEKVFNIIAMLRERTKHSLIIETRDSSNHMLRHAKRGAIAEYVDEELQLRKQLSYPPYSHLIKVSRAGARTAIIKDMRTFIAKTEQFAPRVFSGFIPQNRGSVLHALIRVPCEEWPNTELTHILQSLPASFIVDINPERIL